jgi:cation:H+ antiporter
VSSLVGVALLIAGLALVVGGAELFFDGLLAAASRFRVSPFVLTVVVSGFELENLAAGIAANLKGLGNAAAGTFLGGTTFLALGVSGLSAVAAPIRVRLPLSVLGPAAAAPLPLLALGADGDLSRLDGALLLAWSIAALAAIAYSGRHLDALQQSVAKSKKRRAVVRMVGGLALLSGAGEALGEGLQRVVTHLGVSQSLLGNTAVAAAVEIEEVGRVAVPSKRGRGDIALGNVFGTIAHFAAFNAGVIALVRPIHLDSVSHHLHLPVAAASVLILTALTAWRTGLGRREGAFLLALYAGYVAAAIALSA